MVNHRIHRNALYSLVIILAIIQITSLIILSAQISRSNIELNAKIQSSGIEAKQYTQKLVEDYDSVYRVNFQTISDMLASQQRNFEQEIKLLKSSQEDFSAVVEDAVKGVVSVASGDSVGTGFIISPSGYVVTNNHVLADANDISVLTYDRKKISAELIGRSSSRDLALLQISGNYKYLELADENEIQVGQRIIAIGNPLGLSFTVTEGIISGLHRPGPSGALEYLQTDVPLNPGNSGGPLINTNGKVVGIANFKIGGAESLGFALETVPIREEINNMLNQTIL